MALNWRCQSVEHVEDIYLQLGDLHNAIPSGVHVARSSELYTLIPPPSTWPSTLYSPNKKNLPVSLSTVTPPAWALTRVPSVALHRAPGTIHFAETDAAVNSSWQAMTPKPMVAQRIQDVGYETFSLFCHGHIYCLYASRMSTGCLPRAKRNPGYCPPSRQAQPGPRCDAGLRKFVAGKISRFFRVFKATHGAGFPFVARSLSIDGETKPVSDEGITDCADIRAYATTLSRCSGSCRKCWVM